MQPFFNFYFVIGLFAKTAEKAVCNVATTKMCNKLRCYY